MNFKTLFCALALSLLPTLSTAMGCERGDHTAASCEAGQVWDSATQACVDSVSS
ncbi:hypothetical protein K3556_11135 [Aliiroseovarius sp. M344]|uniref:chitin-binding domain-containing protein n=1 Tax=Aliiroseovarius sp. M344 TaxID=2867010 RepID=UPI0021AE1F60|nr:chitin-binding domain-containing protein [Aliiroseovarius sp. M344]UWQ13494.1 hypothetical protein K3556_11135 [Aliiroseovarius sp. M344]